MGKLNNEIEKKFLLLDEYGNNYLDTNGTIGDHYQLSTIVEEVLRRGKTIRQGYLHGKYKEQLILSIAQLLHANKKDFNHKWDTFRIRHQYYDEDSMYYEESNFDEYFITLKTQEKGGKRKELEIPITKPYFEVLWKNCFGYVFKKRYTVFISESYFEVDVFTDRLLVLAEKEVGKVKDLKRIPRIGLDVTDNKSYSNKNLSKL